MSECLLLGGDACHLPLADQSVSCCVTSPPYYGLRSYQGVEPSCWPGGAYVPVPRAAPVVIPGPTPEDMAACRHEWGAFIPGCNKGGSGTPNGRNNNGEEYVRGLDRGTTCLHCACWRGTLGNEETPARHVWHMLLVLREIWRVLRDDGVAWIVIGDSYSQDGKWGGASGHKNATSAAGGYGRDKPVHGYPQGCLLGIPQQILLAAAADGWVVRNDVVWCLSGGTWLYVRTQKGDMPMMIKDMARLKTETVQLWNGKKWTQLVGMRKVERNDDEIEIVLRSGERISCTTEHRWPTQRGLLQAHELRLGDVFLREVLPEPELPRDSLHIDLDTAWFVGMYIAEGSRHQDNLTLSGHAKEYERFVRVKRIAESYGGSATWREIGNKSCITVYGELLCAIIDRFVTGKIATDKGIAPICWRYSNAFLKSLLQGYIEGDGHWEPHNNRWRLGLCRNYNLERDLRTLCARLGDVRLVLNPRQARYQGGIRPTFHGEIRFCPREHFNCKDVNEIVELRKARCRYVWDIEVADEPHLFALASGILTHNSKLSPMPESVAGWRWQPMRCRCVVQPLATMPSRFAQLERQGHENRDATGGVWVAPQPDPTCPQCGGSGKLEKEVLSKGSWRHTRATETILQLTKQMGYFANSEAVRETLAETNAQRTTARYNTATRYGVHSGRNPRNVVTPQGANLDLPHYASFPPSLIEPLIKATCPERVCPVCGQGWAPVVTARPSEASRNSTAWEQGRRSVNRHGPSRAGGFYDRSTTVHGLRPTCTHYCTCATPIATVSCIQCGKLPLTAWHPGIVLDPFMGSGTSLLVSSALGRRAIGLDLSLQYVRQIAKERLGLNALQAWTAGGPPIQERFDDLPLFAPSP